MDKKQKEIYQKALELRNKRFKDIDKKGRLDSPRTKGSRGHIIEESHFGYSPNNNKEADFPDENLELKVTPIRKNRNGSFSSKERLVLNIIDYHGEIKKAFYQSDFWKKNQTLLLVFYLHEDEVAQELQMIKDVLMYDYPEEDFKIIRRDWDYIIRKIRRGEAHLLSESDTMYLGACPKGSSKKAGMVSQPNSKVPAMKRAYAFKQSYMTQLVRKYVIGKEVNEKIFKDYAFLEKHSMEDEIQKRLKPFIGMKESEIREKFNITTKSKNKNEIYLSKMLGLETKISKTEEFVKANIKPKTVRINYTGTITESMSFSTFKYEDIIDEKWESSTLRDLFESTKFMFVIFKIDEYDQQIFQGVKFWRMPNHNLDYHVRLVWETTRELIQNGQIIKSVSPTGKRTTYFPKMKDNPVSHVRPHARNANDTYPLPVKDKLTGLDAFTKHCFWLNNHYIREQLSNFLKD